MDWEQFNLINGLLKSRADRSCLLMSQLRNLGAAQRSRPIVTDR
jgi:hypothetical protein